MLAQAVHDTDTTGESNNDNYLSSDELMRAAKDARERMWRRPAHRSNTIEVLDEASNLSRMISMTESNLYASDEDNENGDYTGGDMLQELLLYTGKEDEDEWAMPSSAIMNSFETESEPIYPELGLAVSIEPDDLNAEESHELDDSLMREKEERRQRQLKEAREELISSELTYYHRLEILVDNFLVPMKEYVQLELKRKNLTNTAEGRTNDERNGPTEESLKQVEFVSKHIVLIRKFTKQLVAELTQITDLHSESLGSVLKNFAPYFRFYSEYWAECEITQQKLKELKEEAWCRVFVAAVEMQPICENLTLESYFMEPIQRVPRYRMLLENIIKSIREDDETYPDIRKSLETVCKVASQMNSYVADRIKRKQVAVLSLMWDVKFLTPSRIFVSSFKLEKMNSSSTRKYHFLLFNDLFVYGRRKTSSLRGMMKMLASSGEKSMEIQFSVAVQDCLLVNESRAYYASTGCMNVDFTQGTADKGMKKIKANFQVKKIFQAISSREITDAMFLIMTKDGKLLILKAESKEEKDKIIEQFVKNLIVLLDNKQTFKRASTSPRQNP